jgi:hypothetical protein
MVLWSQETAPVLDAVKYPERWWVRDGGTG